jgi:hypothetical protein
MKKALQLDRLIELEGRWMLVPAIGFELMTYRLQGGCSTN